MLHLQYKVDKDLCNRKQNITSQIFFMIYIFDLFERVLYALKNTLSSSGINSNQPSIYGPVT